MSHISVIHYGELRLKLISLHNKLQDIGKNQLKLKLETIHTKLKDWN